MIKFFIGLVVGSMIGITTSAVLTAARDEDRFFEDCFKAKDKE